mmetsp:Transcript_50888/g.135836  ORF Transcript_50888/g.135836 Transcript_50888/m.135836 type:complete len:82 (+) Transcript_50888:63-308(+)
MGASVGAMMKWIQDKLTPSSQKPGGKFYKARMNGAVVQSPKNRRVPNAEQASSSGTKENPANVLGDAQHSEGAQRHAEDLP